MSNKRIYSLDFLKIIATIGIIFHHYQQITLASFPFGIKFLTDRFYLGFLCELFFIISGLVVAKYISKIQSGLSFKDYYLRFFIRFAPLCALSCIVYVILNIIFRSIYGFALLDYSATPKNLILSFLLMQCGWLKYSVTGPNNPIWYISVLMLCYVFLYFSVKVSSRLRISPYYTLVFVILLSMIISKYNISLPLLNPNSARGLFPFFCGVILGRFLDNHKLSNLCALLCGLLFIALFSSSITYPALIGKIPLFVTHVYSLLFLPLVVFFNSDMMRSFFKHKAFGYLGKISFSAFVWHFPFLLFCLVVFGLIHYEPNYGNIIYLLGFELCCYLIAIPSCKYIELPCTEFLSSFMKKHGIIS